MKSLSTTNQVTTKANFLKTIEAIGNRANPKLFHCYMNHNHFIIATAYKVEKFSFQNYKEEALIVELIEEAIKLLEETLPQVLVFGRRSGITTDLILFCDTPSNNFQP